MNPKKINSIITKTSQELNLSESLVDDIIGFYWNQVRNSINNAEHASLKINSLGTFKVKKWKLDSLIEKYNNHIENLSKNNFKYMTLQRHAILNSIKEKLERLESVKKDILLEEKRKEEIKIKREEYINDKNMESKESDS